MNAPQPGPWPPPDPSTLGRPAYVRRPPLSRPVLWRDALILLVILGLAAAAIVWGRRDISDETGAGGDGRTLSGDWDPRIAPLAADVERLRGLAFEEPVEVVFLADDDFVAQLATGYEPTADERSELEDVVVMLRLAGLVEDDTTSWRNPPSSMPTPRWATTCRRPASSTSAARTSRPPCRAP